MQKDKISDIAKEIDRLCRERNISHYTLAKRSGMQDSSVRNMFQKGTTPTFYNLEKMCKGLGITVAQFFGGSELFENFTEEQKLLIEYYNGSDPESQKRILAYAKGACETSREKNDLQNDTKEAEE